MTKIKFAHILGSPLLCILLLAGTSTLAALWYKTEAAQRAPAIVDYDWAKHPNTLLIAYPLHDCGCGISVSEAVEAGLKHGLDVLVIASKPSAELSALTKADFPQSRFFLVTNVNSGIIQQFSPRDKMAVVHVQNGRIIRQSHGAFLQEPFFQ